MSSDSDPKKPREIYPVTIFHPGKGGNVLSMVQGKPGDVIELFTSETGEPVTPPPSALAKHPSASKSEEDEEIPEDTEPPKPVRRKTQG